MRRSITSTMVVGSLACAFAGCEQERPLPLAPSVAATPAPVHYTDPGFPAALPGAVVYGRTSPSSIPGSQRYVFYDDGAFGLQYFRPDWGFFEYKGTYSRDGSAVTFMFDDSNTAGPWVATGTMDGDSLAVRYNVVMGLADFEDGSYTRQPSV